MLPAERRAVYGLAGIYGFRMLGLFMILPVFALYAEHLQHATPFLIGLAVGIYGLTQAILQIPFGLLSDRIGRKPVILGGLMLFALGSVIAALADDIWLVLVGRAIQGSGAIAAAVMALAADLTRESQRTKAMATIGMTIGLSFALSLVAGPILDAYWGVSGIFWLTAVLALVGMLIVLFVIPNPEESRRHLDAVPLPEMFRIVLANGQLLRLDFGIFSLHLILTSLFLAVPLLLRDLGLPLPQHSTVYLVVLVVSVIAMVPFIILAEKYGKMKAVFSGAVLGIGVVGLLMFEFADSWLSVGILLALFFTAFNLLESTLPSLISKTAPVDAKGTAMGVYSTSQFFGGFLGGVLGGWLNQHFGYQMIFIAASMLAIVWFFVALGMEKPGHYRSRVVSLAGFNHERIVQLQKELDGLTGVIEAVIISDEKVAYLKLDRNTLDESALETLLSPAK